MLVAAAADGSTGNELYTVSGIFQLGLGGFDNSYALLELGTLQDLMAMDRAARIGIFSAQHLRAAGLAKEYGVLYKPCGAGGDMGMCMSRDTVALAAYRGRVEREGFLVVPTEISRHGLQVRLR